VAPRLGKTWRHEGIQVILRHRLRTSDDPPSAEGARAHSDLIDPERPKQIQACRADIRGDIGVELEVDRYEDIREVSDAHWSR